MPRIDTATFRCQPWRIHEFASDFQVEDVWWIPTPGAGRDDFARVRAAVEKGGDLDTFGPLTRGLFAVRWWLGARLGWDRPGSGLEERVPSLRHRLPADLEAAATGEPGLLSPVYATDREAVSEMASSTVHALLHLGWPEGGEPGLLVTVLTRTSGRMGALYLRAIAPFRHLIVWPALTASWERAWRDREPVSGALGRRAVDPRSLELLDLSPDYADEFVLTTTAPDGARDWARAMFEESIDRKSRRLIFETLLRMQIAPDGTAGTIAGWQVISASGTHVLMGAAGRLLDCRLLVHRAGDQVRLITAMRYRRRRGRLVWTVLSHQHRGLAPGLLRQAAGRLAAAARLV
ncbi:DUF2867 domain-containing protein [Ruania zhangjianzhongii]|uniref:DUF2867 domain-containing protein n=1 Tax=Ruania zhangjianzhongii TaxID=2603206 RepID=UPI0011CC539F|nr:DUF2867 domain-containing protein [Ruania zhangjianzhongii]